MTPAATPEALVEALDAAATKALADELFTYANQLTRMETQAGLGGKDLSVRVKEPGWLVALMRRAASALQARRLAAAEAALATATAEAARLRAEVEALRADLHALLGAAMVFADMDAMDPPEGVPLNEWLPAITGTRAVVRTALARAATAREGA